MHQSITTKVTLVGGPRLSDDQDCLVYAVDLGELVLIDCGAGPSWPTIKANIKGAGLDPLSIHTLLLTHCHVDHIGAVAQLVAENPGCRVVAHALDVEAIESGDPLRTASSWYGVQLPEVTVSHLMEGEEERLTFPGGELELLHTPGHTPGSLVATVEDDDLLVLFGQDIHGPFSPEFGSDKGAWRESMDKVLALEADILCEGHYGVIKPAAAVRRFIQSFF